MPLTRGYGKMKENALLQIENLNVSFFTDYGEVKAVRDVSLSIFPSEVVGLVGESGCGKSVTSLSILNLVPKPGRIAPSSRIFFKDLDLVPLDERALENVRGSKISMIFQEPMTSLNPVFRVGDQIDEVFQYHTDLSRCEIRERTLELLNQVKIADPSSVYHSYPHELSGGMRQRVMIVMAIALNQELIIADEPTTALDVTVQAQILKLLLEIQKKRSNSILFITHDLGVVSEIADRICIMYAGEIVETGSRDEIFSRPHHPYTRALFEAVPGYRNNFDELKPIPGALPDNIDLPQGCLFYPRCPCARAGCLSSRILLSEKTAGHFSRCIL